MSVKVFWCKSCLNMSTRPRIAFDHRGYCNACVWSEKKKEIDWGTRKKQLNALLDRHRSNDGTFDCMTTVSGGKDGSYVSHMLKHEYNMHPLAVTVRPALEMDIGTRNLNNFIKAGFDHMHVSPNPEAMRLLNRIGFIEKGFPYFGWLIAIQAAPLKIAQNLGINLVFYGEDGEVEYGGSTETAENAIYNIDYMKRVYLEGGYENVLGLVKDAGLNTSFFTFPDQTEEQKSLLELSHWSYFESWDPYRNYLVAKEHCGMEEATETNSGTFTNFAQNDQALYALHAYMMYLKFGFGRATQDAGIEIRRDAMDRHQALALVQLYDGHYPEEHEEAYLNYYKMTKEEFDAVLDLWVNTDLFYKQDGRWVAKFTVGEDITL